MTTTGDARPLSREARLILAAFADGPKYGFQVYADTVARTGERLNVARMHWLIHTLERDGLLCRTADTPTPGGPRTTWLLTRPGQRALDGGTAEGRVGGRPVQRVYLLTRWELPEQDEDHCGVYASPEAARAAAEEAVASVVVNEDGDEITDDWAEPAGTWQRAGSERWPQWARRSLRFLYLVGTVEVQG